MIQAILSYVAVFTPSLDSHSFPVACSTHPIVGAFGAFFRRTPEAEGSNVDIEVEDAVSIHVPECPLSIVPADRRGPPIDRRIGFGPRARGYCGYGDYEPEVLNDYEEDEYDDKYEGTMPQTPRTSIASSFFPLTTTEPGPLGVDTCCSLSLYPHSMLPAHNKPRRLRTAITYLTVGKNRVCSHEATLNLFVRDTKGIEHNAHFIACIADFDTPPLLAAVNRKVTLTPNAGVVHMQDSLCVPIHKCTKTGLPLISFEFARRSTRMKPEFRFS